MRFHASFRLPILNGESNWVRIKTLLVAISPFYCKESRQRLTVLPPTAPQPIARPHISITDKPLVNCERPRIVSKTLAPSEASKSDKRQQ